MLSNLNICYLIRKESIQMILAETGRTTVCRPVGITTQGVFGREKRSNNVMRPWYVMEGWWLWEWLIHVWQWQSPKAFKGGQTMSKTLPVANWFILFFSLQCPTIEQILWSSHSKTFEHREIMEDEAPSHWLRATHELVRFNIHQKPYSYFMLFHVTHSIP